MARFDQQMAPIVRAPSVGPKRGDAGAAAPGVMLGRVKILLASGGMVTGVTGMNGVTCARAATGTYSLSFPPVASMSDLALSVNVKPVASGLLQGGQLPGGSIYTGTALIGISSAAGAGVNGSAGDEINVFFYVDPSILEGAVP